MMYMQLLWAVLALGVFIPATAGADTFLVHPASYARSDLTGRGCKNTGNDTTNDCSGPCDVRTSIQSDQVPPTVVQRGDQLMVSWVKNGNKGGFVRMSLVKRNDDYSDLLTQDRFDANAEKTVCFEPYLSCELSSTMIYVGSDGIALNSYNCSTPLSIREQLQDGLYTLQWVWFGGKSSGDYYSCSDIKISGGPTLGYSTIRFPEWQGGDVYYPGERVCNYYNTRKRGVCIYDQPCSNSTDVNDPYRFLGTDEWRANAPDEGPYDELDPVPVQSPVETSTPTPLPSEDPQDDAGSDQTATIALGVGLPAAAAAMVFGAIIWVKKHPVQNQPTTAGANSVNMLNSNSATDSVGGSRALGGALGSTNFESTANMV